MAPRAKRRDALAATTTKPTKTAQEQASTDWPPMQPLIHPADLSLQEVVPGQILTISNFWSSTLCKTYVSFLSSLPLATTPGKPKKGQAVRVNDRYQIDDAAFAERLWSHCGLKELILGTGSDDLNGAGPTEPHVRGLWGGDVVGLNPNIRIYRYRAGQFFDKHYDDSNNVILRGSPPIPARTTWTLLLYLTSPATGCVGGETVFYPQPSRKKDPTPEPVVVGLEVGMALLHRHGVDCMLHEGREVLKGEKWVIRSDLCVRR